MKTKKLIELWKHDCEHCEATKPILEELEKDGYEIERYDAESSDAKEVIKKYGNEIDAHSKKMGYEVGYIYTPTLINPETKKIVAYEDKNPSKEEITQLASE